MAGSWSVCRRELPLLCSAAILALGSAHCADTGTEPDFGPLTIEVTGGDYEWRVRYPGDDRRLHTDDDVVVQRDVHVPVDTDVTIVLLSTDYIYSFSLPHLDLAQVAIPDLEFKLEFKAGSRGRFPLVGDQLCGYSHEGLMGKLVVHSRRGFARWLTRASA